MLKTSRPKRSSTMQPPIGTLTVFVLDGMDLEAKDATGTSDPFCTLYLNSAKNSKQKTKYIPSTLNPNWGEKFQFPVYDKNDYLVVECYDKDFMSKDFIGSFNLPLYDYYLQPMSEEYFPLAPKPGSLIEDVGKIRLQIYFDNPLLSKPAIDNTSLGNWEISPDDSTQLKQVLQEWLQTEEKYVTDLRILNNHFLVELNRKSLLTSLEVKEIFANFEDIIHLHEKILEEYIKITTLEPEPILEVFEKYLPEFDKYIEYCSNQSNATLKITEYSNTYPAFKDFVGMTRMEYRGLNTESFIVKPLQRLLKYPLLLREIERSDKNHSCIPTVHKLAEQLNAIILQANKATIQKEQARRIQITKLCLEKLGLYRKIIHKNNIYHSFIYSAKVKYANTNKIDQQNGYLIIFDDFLLLAHIEVPKIIINVPLLNLRLNEVVDKSRHLISISCIGMDSIDVELQSVEEKKNVLSTTFDLQKLLMIQKFAPISQSIVKASENKITQLTDKSIEFSDKSAKYISYIKEQTNKREKSLQKITEHSNNIQELHHQVELLNRQKASTKTN